MMRHTDEATFRSEMDHLASSSFLRFEELGSSDNKYASVPAFPALGSNTEADYTSVYRHDNPDISQFYTSSSHYLAAGNPYSHLSWSTFLPSQQEHSFHTILDQNMANQGDMPYEMLGPNSQSYASYNPYYIPQRGRYAPMRCQVYGCTADLSKVKPYHRRNRVCEYHSKAAFVITATSMMPMRFCQQCSRFHEVDEFDDLKKSCRQRLADHNRRRRKPKTYSSNLSRKRMTHSGTSATTKDNGSSSNMVIGSMLGTQELGTISKEHYRGLEQVAREPSNSNGTALVAYTPEPASIRWW